MLETRVLLLRPPAADGSRVVADSAAGAPLGFARWRPAAEQGWPYSLLGPVLSVHEYEEAPLVFTVRRWPLWWAHRELLDAEGERIGYISGSTLRDRAHRVWARRRVAAHGILFEGACGEVLAAARRTGQGVELEFMPPVACEPFAKMLLLAAVLLAPPAG